MPYGNMDTWTVRYIKESGLLGGATKVLHAVGPNDTIRENKAYEPVAGNPWACSETYAKVIVEAGAGGAVIPEKRGSLRGAHISRRSHARRPPAPVCRVRCW